MRIRNHSAWLVLAAASFGCGGPELDESAPLDGAAIDNLEQPVMNGSNGGWSDNRGVQISNGVVGGSCSATAIRDNWVLTARHCLTNDGTATGNLVSPSQITVAQVETSVPNPVPVAINLYAHHALRDLALVRFDRNIGLQQIAESNRAFVEIYGGSRAILSPMYCTGYGHEAYATQIACLNGNPGTSDTGPEFAWLTGVPAEVSSGDDVNTVFNLNRNASNQVLAAGDSGSGCAINMGSVNFTAEYKQAYVHNRSINGCTQLAANDWVRTTNEGPDMVAFRSWVNDILGRYENHTISNSTALCGATHVLEVSPTGTANWSCPGTYRKDDSNEGVTVVSGALHWGPMVVKREKPVSNGRVHVKIWSDDNDTAGVVGRWRDINNWYAFVVNPQDARAQIIKMEDGNLSIIKAVSFTTFLNSWGSVWRKIELRMAGIHLIGMVDDEIVLMAQDTGEDPHTTGYSGMMHAYMDDVRFKGMYSEPTYNTANTNAADSI